MDSAPCPSAPRLRRRSKFPWPDFARLLSITALVVAAGVIGCAQIATRLTINLTTSMPRGLYLLAPARPIERGTIVNFPVPALVRPLVAGRHYLPTNFGLLKRVVALAGDHVCTQGHRYIVGDRLISPIAARDHAGRPLAPFPFCSTVAPGDAVLAAAGDASLDSRYFGPVSLDYLTPAVPLWTSY